LENLFSAWSKFKKGKNTKIDVQEFTLNLEDNLFELHSRLRNNIYQHSHYTPFYICDPKLRHIHKAKVADRVLHNAVVNIIEPIFEKSFIFDSYSSRKDKGTHRAVRRLHKFAWKLSQNNTKTVWVLKCDIKKFFDSVEHKILVNLIKKTIYDKRTVKLIENIISSFCTTERKGIPLGNVTSQLFSNIYLNQLDQYIKRELRVKCYIRYADDFVILSRSSPYLKGLAPKIQEFLQMNLNLQLHSRKVVMKKWSQGTDFLGYISFPYHIVLRTKTKTRILKKIRKRYQELKTGLIDEKSLNQSLQSYFGIFKHCRGYGIIKQIKKMSHKNF